jgi:hypothetical protein
MFNSSPLSHNRGAWRWYRTARKISVEILYDAGQTWVRRTRRLILERRMRTAGLHVRHIPHLKDDGKWLHGGIVCKIDRSLLLHEARTADLYLVDQVGISRLTCGGADRSIVLLHCHVGRVVAEQFHDTREAHTGAKHFCCICVPPISSKT